MNGHVDPGTRFALRRSGAFTLVELLVVIGIIATLIAILLPALNRVRAAGQTVQCASVLRELGQAMTLFASSHEGRMPGTALINKSGSTLGVPWQVILSAEYFRIKDYVPQAGPTPAAARMFCPSAIRPGSLSSYRWYAMNLEITGGPLAATPQNGKLVDLPQRLDSYYSAYYSGGTFDPAATPPGYYYLGVKLSRIHHSPEKYLLWDVDRTLDTVHGSDTFVCKLGDTVGYPSWSAYGGQFSFRHAGQRMNMLFADMHAEGLQCSTTMAKTAWFLPGS